MEITFHPRNSYLRCTQKIHRSLCEIIFFILIIAYIAFIRGMAEGVTDDVQIVFLDSQVQVATVKDEELLDILRDWDLESIFVTLKEAGVGIDELKFINNEDIQQLFPTFSSIGLKAKFREKLKSWKNEKFGFENDTSCVKSDVLKWIEDSDNLSQCRYSPASGSSNNYSLLNVNLEEILKQTIKGQTVIDYYREHKNLTPTHQQILANTLIDGIMRKHPRLQTADFKLFTEKIVESFPSENPDTYYIPRNRVRKHPKGKLHDRYFNLKNRLKGCRESKPESTSDSIIVDNPEVDETISVTLKTWLKYNNSPKEEVIENWKRTFLHRRAAILKGNDTLDDILKEWPLFKDGSFGSYLIDVDFTCLFNNKSNNLLQKWDDFVQKIFPYFKQRIHDAESKNLLKSIYEKNVEDASRDCAIALLLNAVLPPSSRLNTGEGCNKRKKRVTIKEGKDSLILHIKNISDLHLAFEDIRERFYLNNEKLQPLIVTVGSTITNLQEFYVYFDGIKFKFPSFLACLDCCFKVFHVLNLEYPKHSIAVWTFLQKYFYDISLPNDKPIPQVSGLVSYLLNTK